MFTALLSVIEGGLTLVNKLVPDQATKIKNQIIDLREKWNAEMAKGDARDDALLDMYDRELLDISELFLTAIKSASPPS